MVLERFVKQLDGCRLCGGAITGSFNCTCASEAMWLYRATKGRVKTTGCHVRDLTNDCSGGTRLKQMAEVSRGGYGVTGDRLLLPGDFAYVIDAVRFGRKGAHLNIGYGAFRGTRYDCFRGNFGGNHDIYLSRAGSVTATIRTGDPGADGRYSGCPNGFQNIPISLLRSAAGRLALEPGITINDEYGSGKCYAYLTPADPVITTSTAAVVPYEVVIRPLGDDEFRQFNWFQVSGDKVIASHIGQTAGLRRNCSPPTVKTGLGGTAIKLVKVWNAWRDDVWVRSAWAHPRES